jgi:transitional endoplasmic reticulum ATPase
VALCDNAILFLDEIDSFLQDRAGAINNWEVTQVNELLLQMEQFQGVFIAATNLVETLDKSALRRFDAKIKFDYLLSDQRMLALKSLCVQLDIHLPEDIHRYQLESLANLSIGDFASLQRRNKYNPIQTPQDLINALTAESELKSGGKRRIGFH